MNGKQGIKHGHINNPKGYLSSIGFNGKGYQSFVAENTDLVNWNNRRLAMGFGREGEFDHGGCVMGAQQV